MKKVVLLVIALFSLNAVIAQKEIPTKADPSVTITLDDVTALTMDLTFTPNAECASYYFVLAPQGDMQNFANMMGTTVDELVTSWGIQTSGVGTNHYDDLVPNTVYTIFARPYDSNGTPFPLDSLNVTTPNLGGEGLSTLAISLQEITETSVRMIVTPNEETAVFYDGLITLEYFNQIGADSAVSIIMNGLYPQYSTDDHVWMDLDTATLYKAIAVGKNALGEWGEATIEEFSTLDGIATEDLQNSTVDIYPQPNDGHFTVNTQQAGEMLTIFDLTGKLVHQEKLHQIGQQIDASHLPEGQYLVQLEKGRSVTKLIILK